MGGFCSKSRLQFPEGTIETHQFCKGTNGYGESHTWKLVLTPDDNVGLISTWFDTKGTFVQEKLYTVLSFERESETAVYVVTDRGVQQFRKVQSGAILDCRFLTEGRLTGVPETDNDLFNCLAEFFQEDPSRRLRLNLKQAWRAPVHTKHDVYIH